MLLLSQCENYSSSQSNESLTKVNDLLKDSLLEWKQAYSELIDSISGLNERIDELITAAQSTSGCST